MERATLRKCDLCQRDRALKEKLLCKTCLEGITRLVRVVETEQEEVRKKDEVTSLQIQKFVDIQKIVRAKKHGPGWVGDFR